MKVLVVGGGGREHALCWKLKQSPLLKKLYIAPGNAGTSSLAEKVDIPVHSPGALAVWAVENAIDLTIVGPEAPLADGIVDIFTESGLRIFGPTKAAAQLESSKAFSKEVMLKAGIKTPPGETFTDAEKARAHVKAHGAPIVIKAVGLASGKGVVVAQTLEEALEAVDSFMIGAKFGESSKSVVIEQMLVGQEASVMAIVDGNAVLPLVVSQDYKRLKNDDQGPNTGGMGAISPTPVVGDVRLETLVNDIFIPVIRELRTRDIVYRGFLYAGVMVDSAGQVHVIEFNCRLGDPETEVLMRRMKSDLLEVINAAVDNSLSTIDLQWKKDAAACVVIASGGYPDNVVAGQLIRGLPPRDDTQIDSDVVVFHAGTAADSENPDFVRAKGGRVLAVTALGPTVGAAVAKVYKRIESISFDGMQYRNDIGSGAD